MAAPTPEDMHGDTGTVQLLLLCVLATALAAPVIVVWALTKRQRLRDISDDVWFWPAKVVIVGLILVVPIAAMLLAPIAIINLVGAAIFQQMWYLPFVVPASAVYIILLGRWIWKNCLTK